MIVQFVIFQVIVFSVAIFFLKRILSSDARSAETQLNDVYEGLLDKQKQLQKKIEQAEKEYAEKKEEANSIVKKMQKDATTELQAKEDEVMKEAKAQADEMVEKARSAADEMKREIEKEVSGKMIDFVASIMGGALNDKMREALHREFVTDFLGKVGDMDFSNVSPDCNDMSIKSVYPLTDDEKKQLGEIIKGKLGREINMEEKEGKELVAGLVLEFGTLLLDASYASAINDAALADRKTLEEEA